MTSRSKQRSSECTNVNAAASDEVTDAQQTAESLPTEQEPTPKRRRVNETTESTALPCSLHAQRNHPMSNINKGESGNDQPAPTTIWTDRIWTQPAPCNQTDQTMPQPDPAPVIDQQKP